MKLNKENFVKDELFQELIEMEDIYLEYEPSEYTIFVLEDGTAVNSLFYLGDRMTDHHAILQQDEWIIERLITVEPETHTVILPIKPTNEQFKCIETFKNIWQDVRFIEQ